jgi:hypothetical protein
MKIVVTRTLVAAILAVAAIGSAHAETPQSAARNVCGSTHRVEAITKCIIHDFDQFIDFHMDTEGQDATEVCEDATWQISRVTRSFGNAGWTLRIYTPTGLTLLASCPIV